MAETVVDPCVGQRREQRRTERIEGPGRRTAVHGLADRADDQLLAGFPAGERIGVVGEQEGEVEIRVVVLDDHRCRESAEQRRHRRGAGEAVERELLFGRRQFERRCLALDPVPADQAERDRDRQRPVAGRLHPAVRAAQVLAQRQRVAPGVRVVPVPRDHQRRARRRIPAHETGEVAAVRVGDCRDEIVAGDRLAVVALEIAGHPVPEPVDADQGLQHPDHFGAFLVDGRRVEIVDRLVAVRPDRVGHRARILGELRGAQCPYRLDPVDRPRTGRRRTAFAEFRGQQVRRKLLVTEDRQAFLERQLEPVATGDAVAGPVVEVLVADDRLDPREVVVGRDPGIGEQVLRIEDVESLVLHRAHVEIGGRDDHEPVQVEFEVEAAFVPADRPLQALHRMVGPRDLAGLDPDLEQHVAAGAGPVACLVDLEASGDQREQIAGLRKRIHPDRTHPAGVRAVGAGRDQVAVRQQHRVPGRVGPQHDAVGRHHVGPVLEPGDPAKALGLALRQQHRGRCVEAGQLKVACRTDRHRGAQQEVLRRFVDHQRVAGDAPAGRVERRAVEFDPERLERFPVQPQRAAGGDTRPAPVPAGCGDHRPFGREIELEFDGRCQIVRRPVVAAVDRRRGCRPFIGGNRRGVGRGTHRGRKDIG